VKRAWWETGVIYQIYPRSFADSNDDGIGDLEGIRLRLPYLSETLGVDAIWLSPFYPSPQADFGYDVADYTDVDPVYGTLADFDRLLADVHTAGMKLIVDFVPNHTSDQHEWFLDARSSRSSARRDWYVWADPKPDRSAPNNWQGMFGGPAWEFDEATGQYYLHSFLKEQPDLNWRNPQVKEAMFDVLRFWLDRGVDGFRVDVAHFVMKDPNLRDNPPSALAAAGGHKARGDYDQFDHIYDKAHPDVHPLYRDMRAVLDAYNDRYVVGEIHEFDWAAWAAYYGENLDEFHQPFNFALLKAADTARGVRTVVETQEAVIPPGAWPNYVLGNHDEIRMTTRYGDAAARRLAVLLLTLRGTPTLYMGDEIGMLEGRFGASLDPWGQNVEGLGRDGCRTPMQWTADGGFSGSAATWLPYGPGLESRNVSVQLDDRGSLLSLYRALLSLRKGSNALKQGDYATVVQPGESVLVFERTHRGETKFVAINFTGAPAGVVLPEGGHVLISTGDRIGRVTAKFTLEPQEAVVVG